MQTRFDVNSLPMNIIPEETKRFEMLTKIAKKPKTGVTFKPFNSPYIKIDVSKYKKKKRKELLETYDKSKLINYEQFLNEQTGSDDSQEEEDLYVYSETQSQI